MFHRVMFHRPTLILSAVLAAAALAAPARATSWKICNASPEAASVAIVFNVNDARQYISKGWWNIPPNGECRTVFSGNLPITGAFLRAEGSHGSVWEGDSLFCTSNVRFEAPNANVSRQACAARGLQMKAFQIHIVKTANFTTTLRGRNNPGHGFGDDVVLVPANK